MQLRVRGKHDKVWYIPIHPVALRLIGEYMEMPRKHGGGVELDPRPPCSGRLRTTALASWTAG
jgi:hypothetical protein